MDNESVANIEKLAKLQSPVMASVQKPKMNLEDKDHIPFAMVPENMEIHSVRAILDEYLEKPERRTGTAKVDDVSSFVALTNRFKNDDNTVIFAKGDLMKNSIDASLHSVFNYHPTGPDNTKAEWADHKVSYEFPVSKELRTWLQFNGEIMNQAEFTVFLEDNIRDLVVAPGEEVFATDFNNMFPKFAQPTEIFQLSRGLELRSKEEVNNAYRNSDGTTNIQYSTQHEGADGKPLHVPEWFCLGVPVFEGEMNFPIPVRLRYRVKSGGIHWFFEIYRMRDVFDAAFNSAIEKVKEQTGVPVFKGHQ